MKYQKRDSKLKACYRASEKGVKYRIDPDKSIIASTKPTVFDLLKLLVQNNSQKVVDKNTVFVELNKKTQTYRTIKELKPFLQMNEKIEKTYLSKKDAI